MTDERATALIQRYLDGGLRDAELRELQTLLTSDARWADAFARSSRVEQMLHAHLRETAARERIADVSRPMPKTKERRKIRSSWWIATIAAAALAMLVLTVAWQYLPRLDRNRANLTKPHRVLSGTVYADGEAARNFADGSSIRVAQSGIAVVRLADGSKLELDAATSATLPSDASAERTVELLAGGGVFRVAPSSTPFAVATPLGKVTALGTEFSVEIIPQQSLAASTSHSTTPEPQVTTIPLGESPMKFKTSSAWLAVVVLSGMVQVDIGGKSVVLTGGSGEVFAEDGERKEIRISGRVKALDTNTRSLTLEGRKKEGQPAEPDRTLDLSSDVKVVIDGEEKTIFNVAAGASVVLTMSDDGKLVSAITIGRAKGQRGEENRERKLRRVSGELTKIEASALTLTRRGDSGESSQIVTVGQDTKIFVETTEDNIRTGEGGKEIREPKQAAASATDLKNGQRIDAEVSDTGEAVKIIVRRTPPPKVNKEGERRNAEPPRPERREGEGERARQPQRETRREGEGARRESPAEPAAHVAQSVQGLVLPAPKLIRSAKSGSWCAAATWEGGAIPTAGNQVLIRQVHQVVYDANSTDVIRSLFISGTLTFATDRDTRLEVGLVRIEPGDKVNENGFDCDHVADAKTLDRPVSDARQPGFSAICVCCQSKAALLVGTPERPIDAEHSAIIRLHFIDGMDAQSLPAIVCCGGRMDLHGAPLSRTWVKLGASIAEPKQRQSGDKASRIALAEAVTGWRVGDRVLVTSTAKNYANDHGPGTYREGAAQRGFDQYRPATEERIITAVGDDELTLDQPLDFGHRGDGDYRAEVANLSRNVIVESATPDEVRGHTMYHAGSAGSISYAEFRHLGKEGTLGRYALHYHLCGDTMRGSSVVGASIWDSHNRWITLHGTQYLTVHDCVGYRSVGHGFFLEDGTEVYNVFDRNLAVQAFRGRPLPKQLLPFDKNDGAGYWWANSRNSFTRNVAVECDQYGFRFEATPKSGTVVNRERFGDPAAPFDLKLKVRQPAGTSQAVDIRTLPFVRFEDNEIHSMNNYGLNLGEGVGGVGADVQHPFVMRNLKIWLVRLGYRPSTPHVLIDGANLISNTYGIYQPEYVGHDYREVEWAGLDGAAVRRRRMPGEQKDGDGAGRIQSSEVELARLQPVDDNPPQTMIHYVRRGTDGRLFVGGLSADDGAIEEVRVNDRQVKPDAFGRWEVAIDADATDTATVTALAVDAAGNKELTPHEISVAIAE